jgi:uncharacterized protein YdeI (YjbR/CyaY-like superfamily)
VSYNDLTTENLLRRGAAKCRRGACAPQKVRSRRSGRSVTITSTSTIMNKHAKSRRYYLSTESQQPIFFSTAANFRRWLKTHHSKQSQQWVGFHRKHTGKPSITWPQAVDEALCFGWIDGLRKGIDAQSYKIRFTPRRSTSVWSAINTRRIAELIRQGRVHPAGLDAYARRVARKSGIYAYENRRLAILDPAAERKFRANRSAWRWFQAQAPGYRQTAIWWVVSAKKAETQAKRLASVIADSNAKRKIRPLRSVTKGSLTAPPENRQELKSGGRQ